MTNRAKQLLLWSALWAALGVGFALLAGSPAVPKAMPTPGTNVYYFAATALAGGLESDYSNEVAWTNVNRTNTITLAWDASTGTNVTNYAVYHGEASRTYTRSNLVGSVTRATVQLNPTLTNRVVVVAVMHATSIGGPWTQDGTVILETNPVGSRYYKFRTWETWQ